MCIRDRDVTWYELGLDPGDFVLDGDPVAPSPKGGRTPKFSAHVYCDRTAGWMKLILGMVVGLNPGEFVLYGDPAPYPKRGTASSPIIAIFVALEQQRILVKTRSESV